MRVEIRVVALGWAGKARGETGWGEGCIDGAETGNNSNGYHFLNIGTLYMLMLYWPGQTLRSCGEELDNAFPAVYSFALGACLLSSVNCGGIPCIFLQPQIDSETNTSHKTEGPAILTPPPRPPPPRFKATKTRQMDGEGPAEVGLQERRGSFSRGKSLSEKMDPGPVTQIQLNALRGHPFNGV